MGDRRRRRPATNPSQREQELASKAYDLAEDQIERGTASSQVITHFLKAGSSREVLEQQRIEYENKLTEAKIEAIAGQVRIEELYMEAIKAFGSYSGQSPPELEEGTGG
jgi:hypothetical protein